MGYLNRPELTADHFIYSLDSPDTLMYNTGVSSIECFSSKTDDIKVTMEPMTLQEKCCILVGRTISSSSMVSGLN